MRQVVLDTETTGLEPEAGHRIIEIGCVELVNRRPTQQSFHRYINPERSVDLGALDVHGIDDEFLATQPRFDEVAEEFVDFVAGAELVIHNAEFDIAFINHELQRLNGGTTDITRRCQVLDTLALARRLHPGQRNSLDALAKRYQVDHSKRDLHGALLDARILAEVYLAMTGGQASLSLDGEAERTRPGALKIESVDRDGLTLVVPGPSADELAAHRAMLESLAEQRGSPTLWQRGAADEPL
ncbi:MAG: DNA polymerase III subunit epsilon [Rhodospirillaceae bacterium]|nr:DNA polymerase III subunit epsilon [Rhodospirillaceae bacterium]